MIHSFENFELDTELFELRRQGERVPIEPQVFNVLQYLIEHADHVVSKEELLEALWPGKVVSESALTSRLKTARKLVGDNGRDQRLIKTLHGRGYRFVGTLLPRITSIGDRQLAAGTARPTPALPRRAPAVPPPPGREAELEALTGLWHAAENGALSLVFVEGEAGIGKTTLIEAFCEQVREEGRARIAVGQCIELGAGGEAFMPTLDALGALCIGPDRDSVVATLESSAPSWLLQLPGVLGANERSAIEQRVLGVTQERMLREFTAAVYGLSADQPLLLVLEDLHWADPSTLTLLAWLGRRRESMRAMIVGTHRPTRAQSNGQSLYEVVYGLRLRGLAHLMSLQELGDAAIADFLAQRFGGAPLEPDIADALHQRTEGNPLFLAGVLETWLERGLLRSTTKGLELNASLDALFEVVPDSLRRLIEEQIDRLDAADRRLIVAACVAGDRFSAALIEAMLGTDCALCEDRLTTLAAATPFLARDGETRWPDGTVASQFRFRHTLYRETIYASVPARQRARLHGLAARRLEAGYAPEAGERAAELAMHFTAAGVADEAARYRLQAAQQAYARGGYREVIAHLEQGLALLRSQPNATEHDDLELSCELLMAPALIQTNGWSDPRAEAALTRALELATRLGDERLPSALYLLAAVHELRGEYAESQRVLEHQQTLPETFDNALAELESHELMACSLYHQGAFEAALRHARAGLAAGGDFDLESNLYAYGENPRVSCHNWAGLALWFLGFPDQARAAIESGLALARKPVRRFSLSNALCQAATLHQLRGEPEAALAYADEAIDVAHEEGFRYPLAVARIIKGWAIAVSGEPAAGIALVREGLEGHRASGAAMDRPYYLGLLAEALRVGGERTAARDTLDEALGNIDASRRFFHEAELLRLAANLVLDEPEADEAQARMLLERSHAVAEERGNRIGQLRARADLLRLAAGARNRKASLADLRQAYAAFSEGFDTEDLRGAAALLR